MRSRWQSATHICYIPEGTNHLFIHSLVHSFTQSSVRRLQPEPATEKKEWKDWTLLLSRHNGASQSPQKRAHICLMVQLVPRSLICGRNRWPLLSGPELSLRADQYPALSPWSLDTSFVSFLWLRELCSITLCVCLRRDFDTCVTWLSQVNKAAPCWFFFLISDALTWMRNSSGFFFFTSVKVLSLSAVHWQGLKENTNTRPCDTFGSFVPWKNVKQKTISFSEGEMTGSRRAGERQLKGLWET